MAHLRIATALALLLPLAALAGCAAQSRTSGLATGPAAADPPWLPPLAIARWPGDPRALPIFRGDTGEPASWSELVEAAAAADAVLLGELHGHKAGQAFQEALWTDLLAAAPAAVAALEFFERDQQYALDDYLTGVTDHPTFLRAARRSRGNYPPGHRAIVESSKAAGRPVVAANAPRRYVRLARTDGFDRLRSLTSEQQRTFVVPPHLPEGRYREEFMALMTGGGHGDAPDAAAMERAEAMFRAQSTWDWTMADSVARGLSNGHRPVLLIVGAFHVEHRGGTVQALESLRPGARILTITNVGEWSDTLAEDDKGRADFVVSVGPEESR